MTNSVLVYSSSLIRTYWSKNVIFSLETSTGSYRLFIKRDLHTSLSVTSVLLLFLVFCNVSVCMTAHPASQCAEHFWLFTVVASTETNTLHLLPKDRQYLCFCIHCFFVALILTIHLKVNASDIFTVLPTHFGNFGFVIDTLATFILLSLFR
jgi:hypothetical protein